MRKKQSDLAIYIYLPYDANKPQHFHFVEPLFQKIEALFTANNIYIIPFHFQEIGFYHHRSETIKNERKVEETKKIHQRRLFHYTHANKRSENKNIARTIYELIISKQYFPNEIAVAMTGENTELEEWLKFYHVPYYKRRKTPLAKSITIKNIVCLSDLLKPYLAVDEFLSCIWPFHAFLPIPFEKIIRLLYKSGLRFLHEEDNLDEKNSNVSQQNAWTPLNALYAIGGDDEKQDIEILKKFMDNILLQRKCFADKNTFIQHLNNFFVFVETIVSLSRLRENSDDFVEKEAIELFEKMKTNITDISSSVDHEIMSFEQALQIFTSCLDTVTLSYRSNYVANYVDYTGVRLIPIDEIGGCITKLLVIPSLNDGVFPRERNENLYFSDHNKRFINRSLRREIFRTTFADELYPSLLAPYQSEDVFLLALTLAVPQSSLIISHSLYDSDDKEILPSPFVDEIVSMCSEHDIEILHKHFDDMDLDVEHYDMVDQNICLDINSRYAHECERFHFYYHNGPSGQYSGNIDGDQSFRQYTEQYFFGPKYCMSSTQIDHYTQCGFRYFLQHVLKIQKDEKYYIYLDNLQEGTLYHEILESFFRKIKNELYFPFDTAEKLELALSELYPLVTSVLNAWKMREYSGHPLFFDIFQKTVENKMSALLKNESQIYAYMRAENDPLQKVYIEQKFGMEDDNSWPHLKIPYIEDVLNEEPKDIYFRGSIDRIDVSPSSITVIDYKSGRVENYNLKLGNKHFLKTDFQLALYLVAVYQNLAKSYNANYIHYDAQYLGIATGTRGKTISESLKTDLSFLFSHQNIDSEQMPLAYHVSNEIYKIIHGQFMAQPKSCKFCDFISICRAPKEMRIN